jgi:hypothetical protein
MSLSLLLLLLSMAPPPEGPSVEALIQEVAASGRVLAIAQPPSERVSPAEKIAPGAPPLLRFRYLEGRQRQRFGELDLVMDDAAH